MICRRCAPVGAAEQATVLLEFPGIGERQEKLVGQPQRQARRGLGFRRQTRREDDGFFGQQCAGQCHDRRIRRDRTVRRLHAQSTSAPIDPSDSAAERDRQVGAMGGDHRAVTLDNAPIHPAVVVPAEINRRHPFEFSPADIGAGGADEVVPASVRIEQCGGRDVPRLLRRRGHARKKFLARVRNAACSDKGNPIEAEGRIQGGGVLSIERPCASAISRQGLRSAECSQPQPRSIGRRGSSPIVQARPPSRWRASINRQSIPASFSLRHAATPAAPPPTITTSVSLFATRCSATSGRKGRLRHQTHNLRLRLGHDPEKWIPVFGKDHAPTKARRREPTGRQKRAVVLAVAAVGNDGTNAPPKDPLLHTFSRAVNAGSIATSSPPASLMEQLLYL